MWDGNERVNGAGWKGVALFFILEWEFGSRIRLSFAWGFVCRLGSEAIIRTKIKKKYTQSEKFIVEPFWSIEMTVFVLFFFLLVFFWFKMIPRQDTFHLVIRLFRFDSIVRLPLLLAYIYRMPGTQTYTRTHIQHTHSFALLLFCCFLFGKLYG